MEPTAPRPQTQRLRWNSRSLAPRREPWKSGRATQIEDQGYTIVPDFIAADEIARIRHAFDTAVHITEMRAIGTKTGKTWRAHNLLAKTRAVDYLFLVPCPASFWCFRVRHGDPIAIGTA